MTNRKSSYLALASAVVLGLASLLLLPKIAYGASASIALSSDKAWGWAVGKTQAEANKSALEQCSKGTKTNDCKLSLHKGIARAEGGEMLAYAWSANSLSEAKKAALKSCGNADCKVTEAFAKPGFFSLFKSKGSDTATYFLAHGYSDSDLADADAKAGCEKNSGNPCSIVISSAISGVIAAPKSAPASAVEKSCRPNTPKVRCTWQCSNGNCEVTYKNGCKMRVQVPAKFDPFTNQWTYPAPSC